MTKHKGKKKKKNTIQLDTVKPICILKFQFYQPPTRLQFKESGRKKKTLSQVFEGLHITWTKTESYEEIRHSWMFV